MDNREDAIPYEDSRKPAQAAGLRRFCHARRTARAIPPDQLHGKAQTESVSIPETS